MTGYAMAFYNWVKYYQDRGYWSERHGWNCFACRLDWTLMNG